MLEVRKLTVAFPTGFEPVHDVSFEIAAGERVALVGESGSGKTVTALALLRLLPGNVGISGSARLMETEIYGMSDHDLNRVRGRRIAMVFQEPASALNPVLRIGTQLKDVIRRHRKFTRRQSAAVATDMLRRCGLPEPARRMRDYPHQLSGGMRQRVMIAMAMVCMPELLIADEPTTALDVTTQAQVLECLVELTQASNTALLLITHDLAIVAEYCSRVLVMQAGEIVEQATVTQLFEQPRHRYTQKLIAAIPRLDDPL